jgi:uncharacterized protein
VADWLPPAVLTIVVGVLVMAAVLTMVVSERAHVLREWPGAVVAGLLSGFMNRRRWSWWPCCCPVRAVDQVAPRGIRRHYPGLLPGVECGHAAGVGSRATSLGGWIAALTGLAVGLLAGTLVARRVAAAHARTAVVVLDLVGSAATVVKGGLELLV